MPLDQIDVVDRLRPVDQDHVEVQAASMRERGLDQAIVVRPSGDRFRLVAGAHRLAAAQMLDWTAIRAEVRRLTDDEARLIEIDENLVRRSLDALDQSLFLTEKKAVWERLYPETKNGGDRVSDEARSRTTTCRSALGFELPATFSEASAEKTGLSQRSIQRALEIGRGLSPEAIRHLRETKLTNNASVLRAIAKETAGHQVSIARMLAGGEAASLHDARAKLGLVQAASPALTQQDQADVELTEYRALLVVWEKTSEKARALFVEHLRKLRFHGL